MFDVEIKFRVRKYSHEAETMKQLRENIFRGIGKNEMNCIEVEDLEIKIR